jgi:hypothetical protein
VIDLLELLGTDLVACRRRLNPEHLTTVET